MDLVKYTELEGRCQSVRRKTCVVPFARRSSDGILWSVSFVVPFPALPPGSSSSPGSNGFGPALAADFLKELGVKELGKPDLWVRRILTAAGLAPPDASEVQVQRVFWKMWDALGDDYPPIIIDKLMFLVGSGRFEMVAPMHLCRSRFPEFQERVAAVATSP